MRILSRWNDARARGLEAAGLLLLADVDGQELAVVEAGALSVRLPMSTSRNGLGSEPGSRRTPPGWHAVRERIGGGFPAGSEFRDRQPTGRILPPEAWRGGGEGDLILTRILWLEGLEPGINRGPGCDTHDRYIYLHGTNHEHLLGTPASAGCLRLGNLALADLFDRCADRPVWCYIGASIIGP